MALKADRHEMDTDISYFYNAAAATRGGVVCLATTSASGAAMDQGDNLVSYQATTNASVPVGILMNDVVNKDLTRTHLNQYKDEVQLGGKVTIMTKGYVVTSNVEGTPVAGELAFASPFTAGSICNATTFAAASGELAIGRFMSAPDADGYCKVSVNLPNAYGS